MKFLLLVASLLLGFFVSKAQVKSVDLDIENNDDYTSFSMLDSSIMNKTVYFTGENHNFRLSNYKLQLKMLKYLYTKTGTRHLFLEFGVSRGWLVNNYVQTGDTNLYSILTKYSYDEYAQLYKGLMEFNKTLPEDKKIMVHGIDIERSYSTPIKAMSMLLPVNKKIPESIALNIETLKALSGKVDDEHNVSEEEEDENNPSTYYNYNDNRYNTENTLEIIVHDYDSLKSEYQNYLGDNAPLFDEIIFGLKAEFKRHTFQAVSSMQSFIFREQFMYNQMLELVKKYPGEKFYGQFGRCHTPFTEQDKWCDYYYFQSLATRLNNSEEENFKNKVMSVGIYYPESTTFEINAGQNDQLSNLFSKYEKKGLKLIKINPSDTLFKGVSDKYQFLIINYTGFTTNETNNDHYNYSYDDGFSYGFLFPNLEAHAGLMWMDLSSLDLTFTESGLPSFKSPQKLMGGAFTIYEDWYLYGSASFQFIPKTTVRYNDTSELSFGAYFIKGYFGIETTASEKLNITPRLGIGYGRLNFTQKFDQSHSLPSSPNTIFVNSSTDKINYFNPAFLLDPGIDIRYNIRYVALGFVAGYQLDLSEKQWFSSESGVLGNTPKTSLSGLYTFLTLSFFYSL